MTDLVQTTYELTTSPSLKRRHAKEARFKWYGRIAILIALSFLVFMFSAILLRGMGAFQQTKISLEITFSEQVIDPSGTRDPETLALANFGGHAHQANRGQSLPNPTAQRVRYKTYAAPATSS